MRRLTARLFAALLLLATLANLTGCRWAQSQYDSMRGKGFTGWSDDMGGIRGKSDAAPSGYFTDRRSDQIEQSLGGGF